MNRGREDYNRLALAQGAAGTTVIAAAVPGKRHRVLGFALSQDSGGGSTWKFQGSVSGDLSGAMFLDKTPLVYPADPEVAFVETNLNEDLSIVTTGKPYRGVIIYVTEA